MTRDDHEGPLRTEFEYQQRNTRNALRDLGAVLEKGLLPMVEAVNNFLIKVNQKLLHERTPR